VPAAGFHCSWCHGRAFTTFVVEKFLLRPMGDSLLLYHNDFMNMSNTLFVIILCVFYI
jgi:hypothetical protein